MIPPGLRLLAVAVIAAALFWIGQRLLDSRRLYALILQGGACGLAYLDVFFALKTFGYIGPATGFALFVAMGVATTLVAVRRESRALAVLGLGGAFLAPVLASSGGGNHVMLFSYYMLLNLFVLGVSWFRAWRELNLTGWGFTFVIGLLWGKANYRPEIFGSVEPFVLAFFAIYLVIPILFATRQPPMLKGLVDGTLVFGTPAAVAVMQASLTKDMPYGLAWSAAIGAGLYALLAVLTWRRENMRLLAETYAALAVGLGTLAVFFACDAYPTFALWTLEGAALLWVGLRQDRPLARGFAVLVQLAGAGMFITEYSHIARPHWLMNDALYGCLLIAIASLISANLMRRYAARLREWELLFGPALLLWGAAWWSAGGMDAIYHRLDWATVPNAASLFFLVTFAATEVAGRRMSWSMLRNLANLHPPVLAAVLILQFDLGQHPLSGMGWLAWPAGFMLAFWSLLRQEGDGIAAGARARYIALWILLAMAATWEEMWLLGHDGYVLGMVFAAAAHLAAYLRFFLREEDKPGATAGSTAVLLWAMVFWFANGYAYANVHLNDAALVAAVLGFVAASALAYEFSGSVLGWPHLRQASNVLWIALPVALMVHIDAPTHPFASFGWIAWPAAYAVAYWSLYRHESDTIVLAREPKHAGGLWLALVIAGVECSWLLKDWGFGSAWQTSVWGICAAAAMALAVIAGNCGIWPVAANRATYRLIGLAPIAAFTALWVLLHNIMAPGGMAPLPYLPLLNPLDAMVATSLAALWMWSGWLVKPGSDDEDIARITAGTLGFIWLNGIALRSIHFWADVPYELAALHQSVLVQATLSLLWTATAMALMFLARRYLERGLWIAGAVLLAVVVAKLFTVDLANSGTVARIVSFMGVGGLLLLIGYLAPVPPGEKNEPGAAEKDI